MQVQVSLTIERAATADVTEMEQQIQQAGQQAMRADLKQAIRQWEEHHTVCPHCGEQRRQLEGTTRRLIATLFGQVAVPRRSFRCQGCGRSFCPANGLFVALKGGTESRALARSGHAGWLFVALPDGSQHAQKAQWCRDQHGRDPVVDQSAWLAASRRPTSRGRAGMLLGAESGTSSATT